LLRLNDILDNVSSYAPAADLDVIKKAYVYSAKVHQGQIRKSGEPYLIHPLEVAGILAEMRLDEASIVTGLLHDTIEDTLATREEISEIFGEEVAELVDGVTKLSQFSAGNTQEEKQAENFRRMVVAMAKDIRVLLVKLADRTHNMRTLDFMSPEKQQQIARETLDIYAPLANRLGIQWIKIELEDLSFKYLQPQEYAQLTERVAERAQARDKFIHQVVEVIGGRMAEQGIPAEVKGRVKHVYSIWRKMRIQALEFDQIHDLIAFRVIVDSVAQCYESLGLVHSLWKPVPGRFKDYIAIPKPNMYQSLHTTVIGPEAERVEIQIRTREMHRIAEEGVAAHWAYKEGKRGVGKKADTQKFAWLRQLLEWQRDLPDPKEFIETVKVDLFADEVFVFTPKGDVKSLPRGATPVDFAYSVHSQVGEHTIGAKVNGKIVPLRYRLKNGDTVEVLTSPSSHPSKDWLGFVKTSRAQARIRSYVRQLERKRSHEIGLDIADRELRRFGMSLHKLQRSGELEKSAQAMGFKQGEDLIVALGYGKVEPRDFLKKFVSQEKLSGPAPEPATGPTARLTELFRKVAGRSAGAVRISGIDDVLVRFARCCNPVAGDDIVGFVSLGRGVTVHVRGCEKTLDLDPLRRVEVNWDVRASEHKRPVSIKVITDDRPGVLAAISQQLSEAGMNITNANCRTIGNDKAVNTFEFAIGDLKALRDVMKAIERLEGVMSVERLYSAAETQEAEGS
jgi:GTP pyrophosphokinase